jgi:hypothetical protein
MSYKSRGACPFCKHQGGTLEVDWYGEGSEFGPSILHSLPACDTFYRLTGDEFVQAVIDRKHLS